MAFKDGFKFGLGFFAADLAMKIICKSFNVIYDYCENKDNPKSIGIEIEAKEETDEKVRNKIGFAI